MVFSACGDINKWMQAKIAIAGAIIIGATAYVIFQHQVEAQLREQNAALSQQFAQLQGDNEKLSKHAAQAEHLARLSVPPKQYVAPPPTDTVSNELRPTALIPKLLKDGRPPSLTHEQVEAYLKANGTNASSLLAAFQLTDDPALLQEAMEKFPNDPHVDFRAAMDTNLPPEQQRQWLNAFEQSAPDNALANYLSAQNYFNSGQSSLAVQELNAAAGKTQFQDYSMDALQNMTEAYLDAGYPAADAQIIAGAQLGLPQLSAMKQFGQDLVGLAGSYQQSGDTASANLALQTAVNVGQSLGQSGVPFLINSLVAMNIEYNGLKGMDPGGAYGDTGQTVQNEMDQLNQQKTAMKEINNQFYNAIVPQMSDQDWQNFEQREFIFGETAAEKWAVGKYVQPQ
jgi:hypothetical protein